MRTLLTLSALRHHSDRHLRGARRLATVLGERLSTSAEVVSGPTDGEPAEWDVELASALPALTAMSRHVDDLLAAGRSPVNANNVCSVALATIPAVARHRPDAVVVWFDAHPDLHTPSTTASGYLGGLALAGPLGLWDSGLGSGLVAQQTVLVGIRDIDTAERDVLARGEIAVVAVGEDMAERLRDAVAGRPVYVHIDCDVLQPGQVPLDYEVDEGMTLSQLRACMAALAENEVVGIEIGELEAAESAPDPLAAARAVVAAVEPVLQVLRDGGDRA